MCEIKKEKSGSIPGPELARFLATSKPLSALHYLLQSRNKFRAKYLFNLPRLAIFGVVLRDAFGKI